MQRKSESLAEEFGGDEARELWTRKAEVLSEAWESVHVAAGVIVHCIFTTCKRVSADRLYCVEL